MGDVRGGEEDDERDCQKHIHNRNMKVDISMGTERWRWHIWMKMEYLASCYLSKIIRWHIKHNHVMPFKDPTWNMRVDRQDNSRQSKAEHAISPVSHITFKGESVDA